MKLHTEDMLGVAGALGVTVALGRWYGWEAGVAFMGGLVLFAYTVREILGALADVKPRKRGGS